MSAANDSSLPRVVALLPAWNAARFIEPVPSLEASSAISTCRFA